MRVIRHRRMQVVDSRGSIDATGLNELFEVWLRRDTNVEAIATAGRIRKFRVAGKWDERDQAAFERKHAAGFVKRVEGFIKRMDRKGENRI